MTYNVKRTFLALGVGGDIMAGKPGRPEGYRKPLNARMIMAAEMCAAGEAIADIAAKCKASVSTVDRWLAREDVHAIFVERVRALSTRRYARSVRKIDELVDNDNQWLALQAAQASAARSEAVALGADAASGVQITINQGTGNAPTLGMPDRPDGADA